MKILRAILLFLWMGMLAMTLFTIYYIYVNLTRSDGVKFDQVILNICIGFVLAMITYRSFMTLYTGKVSEKLSEDPRMSSFRLFMMILGLPALIVPGIFLYNSLPENSPESETIEMIGGTIDSPGWHPDPGFVFAFVAGIILTSFGILYPMYVKRLVKKS